MFVIVLESDARPGETVSWGGRRHDDADAEFTTGGTADGLFDAVFGALHDGEQLAIGVPAPVGATVPDGPAGELTLSEQPGALGHLVRLLGELGTWRPWTVVTTSRERWVATQSILVWECPAGATPAAAVASFFAQLAPARSG